MNSIKKWSGLLWISLAIAAGYFNIMKMGIPKIESGTQEDLVFGLINLCLLTPIISGGLMLFGYYCIKDEYKNY